MMRMKKSEKEKTEFIEVKHQITIEDKHEVKMNRNDE